MVRGLAVGASLIILSSYHLLSPCLSWGQSTGSATVTITVTPGVTKSLTVELVGGTTAYDLGSVFLSSMTVGTTAYLVTNTGNISVAFTLQISSETDPNPGLGIAAPGYPWLSIDTSTADLTTATDRYKLFAQFSSSTTTPAAIQTSMLETDLFLVKKSAVRAAGTTGGQFASSSENGASVSAVPGQNLRGLFFGIRSPGFTTTQSSKHLGVTVSAQ